jgi:tetratricopeptide (TPR) repeat protein
VQVLNSLAIVYSIKGKYDEALSHLKKSVKFQPDSTEAYYYMASIYARQKKVERSTEWLRQAVLKGYNNWDHLKRDSNLKNIRNSSYFKALIKEH